jgi:hypothetical protein
MAVNNTEEEKKEEKNSGEKKESKTPFEYWLVIWMLVSLTLLLLALILLPAFFTTSKRFIEYSKWILPALLGAYGAWIGAGAAYFFGKENLKLSSKSTQDALESQQKMSKKLAENALIEDIKPTPLNPHFKFTMISSVKEVITELDKNVDYWFVPVLEEEKMKDVIHTEALWRYLKFNPKGEVDPLSEVIKYIDEKNKTKASKLHGFFAKFKMDNQVGNVLKSMTRRDVSVGVVCDEQDKATHCFSRKDLRSFLLGGD